MEDNAIQPQRLAQRLGLTVHASPLRYKVRRLMAKYPGLPDSSLEGWLLDVANSRGANVVSRHVVLQSSPTMDELSNEELVVACCQPNCIAHPQLLRPAAQLVSRSEVEVAALLLVARRERACRILAELARQAIKVEPGHLSWSQIHAALAGDPPLRDTLIHWTRLAEPIMEPGKPNAQGWRLVA